MSDFYLVCGVSGGGKSTLSKKILRLNEGITFFDVDKYYEKINGDECIRKNTFEVWHTLFRDIHDSEMRHEDVLLTTSALSVSQRRQFIEWFPTFSHHMMWVTSPKDKCLIGNISRRRHVPEEVLLQQWQEMEFPNANEAGWKTISQITNCWDNDNYIIFNLKGDIQQLLRIHEDN